MPDNSPNGSFDGSAATFADSGVLTFGFINNGPVIRVVPSFTGLFQNGTMLKLEGTAILDDGSSVPFEAEWIGQELSRSLPEPSGREHLARVAR